MLNGGAGSLENFFRIARVLGLSDGTVDTTNPLNTGIC